MTMRIGILGGLLIPALLITSASPTKADDGWYLSSDFGALLIDDSGSHAVDTVGNAITFETEFDPGFVAQGAAGYAWRNFRFEGEASYRRASADTLNVTAVTLAGVGAFNTALPLKGGGDVTALGLMANGWYDFDLGAKWRPFIGGGVGIANVSLNDVTGDIGGTPSPLADDDDWVLAYQAGAGIGYQYNPSLTISLGYRFFATANPEFRDPDGVPFDGAFQTHSLMLGLRVQF